MKYQIGRIGWYNFERLIKTLLKKVVAHGVTSFGGSKDGGRDAAYAGTAAFPSKESPWSGEWVFQVKYIDIDDQGGGAAARSALKSAFKKEFEAIFLRKQRIDNYVLLTDVPLTTDSRSELGKIPFGLGYRGHFIVVDGNEVCEWLDIYPELRRSFPQLLGLSDLGRILHSEIYSRSRAYFEQWAPRLATFVQTDAFITALRVLREHHFLVLDGPPETGKSMIAAAVATLHASEGFEVYDVRSPDQIHAIAREAGKKLFVADDAIGSISLESGRNDSWTHDLPGIMRLLDGDHLLIWTARHYILEEALATSALGDTLDNFPGEHEVVVEIGKLLQIERAEILYNHAKQATLSAIARGTLRDIAQVIVDHPNFTPERIRQLVEFLREDKFTNASNLRADILQFLDSPGARWAKAYRTLSDSEQALLTSLLDLDESPPRTTLLTAYENRIGGILRGALPFADAVTRLKHSFITVTRTYQGMETINFKHPSLRDLLLSELRNDPTARRRHIELTSPVGLANLILGLGRKHDE